MARYIGHPYKKVARASHTLLVAFLSSTKESEEDERNELKEHLVYYYMQRSLEVSNQKNNDGCSVTLFSVYSSSIMYMIR